MSAAITLLELLAELGRAELTLRRGDSTVAVAGIALAGGRQLLAIERTYREGTRIILDPTPEELETARSGDLWQLWSSDRAALLHSVVSPSDEAMDLFPEDHDSTDEGAPPLPGAGGAMGEGAGG